MWQREPVPGGCPASRRSRGKRAAAARFAGGPFARSKRCDDPDRRRRMTLAACARGLLLGALVLVACRRGDEPGVLVFHDVRLLVVSSPTPPPDDAAGWTPAHLPDLWTAARRRAGLEGWYRATVTLSAAPDALWAVYFPRLNMNAAVWVNGQFVGDGGRLWDPIGRRWTR